MCLKFSHVMAKSLDIRDHALVLLSRQQSRPPLKIIPFFLNPVSHNPANFPGNAGPLTSFFRTTFFLRRVIGVVQN